jgi:hypothetical protein
MFKTAVTILCLVIMTLSSYAKENLIKNGTFKNISKGFPSEWRYYGHRASNIWVKVKQDDKTLANYVEINDDNSKLTVGIRQAIKSISPRHDYFVTVSCKGLIDKYNKANKGLFLQLRFLPSKKKYQASIDTSNKDKFKSFSLKGLAPEGSKSAEVYIYSTTKNHSSVLIEQVSMIDLGQNKEINNIKETLKCPEIIPKEWLAKSKHPVMVCSRKDYFRVRDAVNKLPWIKSYLETQKKKCAYFLSLNDKQLRDLVPPPGSVIVYGLGYNTDPIKRERLQWCGWKQAFKVRDKAGNIYPNEKWKDDKYSSNTKNHNGKYYFTFRAYGFIHKELEQVVIPALADCYALTGEKKYARTAAVLLDSIAAAYPKNHRGPIDYPQPKAHYDRGGRLDRATYMVARGLYNYASAIDLITPSGELEKASLATNEKSIRENIIRNMLWDGGLFCLDWAIHTKLLTNGRTDYFRGSGIVGVLLGNRNFFDPMVKAMRQLIEINIDRNGFYYETSTTYENHTIKLYTTMAELIESGIVAHNWKDLKSLYSDKKLCSMISYFFDRREIGGHMPPIGDDGPDSYWNSPLYRDISLKTSFSNRFLKNQIKNSWIILKRGKTAKERQQAAVLLKNSFPEKEAVFPVANRWAVFNIGRKQLEQVESVNRKKGFFNSKSIFYGAKGIALLRGGKGNKRYGAQLFWGPISVHGQRDIMSWLFVSDGVQWSFAPGYCNTHFRFGWNGQSISHQMMTVNEKSVKKTCGNGHLETWFDSPAVQWVSASHPDAYSDYGVKHYKRLIAQVQNPKTQKLAYWLDIGMLRGGKVRDDSFHTLMTKAESKLPLKNLSQYSLFGDMYKGMSFGSDYKLSGFRKKGFYWTPPGDGYGFLTKPKTYIADKTQRITFSNPGLKIKKHKAGSKIVVDFSSQPDSKVILAHSTGASHWIPSVPYIIRRQTGDAPSIFTKVIRVMQKNESDPIKKVSMLKVSSKNPFANACRIEWKSGNSDIWLIANGLPGYAKLDSGISISSDALVAMITIDVYGKVIAARMSGGTYLKFAKFNLAGKGIARAKVKELKVVDNYLQVSVVWKNLLPKAVLNSQLLTSSPPFGLDSTWSINRIIDNKIFLNDFSSIIAITNFKPISGKPGWFKVNPPISTFSTGKHYNHKLIKGKRIAIEGKVIATIAECKAGLYRLVFKKQQSTYLRKFKGAVVALASGDDISIPMNAAWRLKQ